MALKKCVGSRAGVIMMIFTNIYVTPSKGTPNANEDNQPCKQPTLFVSLHSVATHMKSMYSHMQASNQRYEQIVLYMLSLRSPLKGYLISGWAL